jgi:hypothetical protein
MKGKILSTCEELCTLVGEHEFTDTDKFAKLYDSLVVTRVNPLTIIHADGTEIVLAGEQGTYDGTGDYTVGERVCLLWPWQEPA